MKFRNFFWGVYVSGRSDVHVHIYDIKLYQLIIYIYIYFFYDVFQVETLFEKIIQEEVEVKEESTLSSKFM